MSEVTSKIPKRIVGYQVKKEVATETVEKELKIDPQRMSESIGRPDVLVGSTYKIKTPQSEHALYITINDIILNEGTEHEERRPYEIFINSKNMEHFQWVLALTRVISAVFRKGGDVTFLVEELKAVFDPKGGYFKKAKFYNSLVSELGAVIETHMLRIGMIQQEIMPEYQKEFLDKKRIEFEGTDDTGNTEYPAKAILCNKCNTKAMILMDGCMTCLNCGDSKCG